MICNYIIYDMIRIRVCVYIYMIDDIRRYTYRNGPLNTASYRQVTKSLDEIESNCQAT